MRRFTLLLCVLILPGLCVGAAAQGLPQTDWVGLADRQLWGVLIAIIVTALLSVSVFAGLMVKLMSLISSLSKANKEENETNRLLARDMSIVITHNAEAITAARVVMERLDRSMEGCPARQVTNSGGHHA